MPDISPRVIRPRGRPRKDAQLASADQVMVAAIEAFSIHGYNGVSLRTVNDELGVNRNLLYQRFGSKANLWRAAVDWAYRPLVEHLEAADDESAEPMVRLKPLIRNFVEYSATRPYLARLVSVEGAARTDRLDYLYDRYVAPVRARFLPILGLLRDRGKIRDVPSAIFCFLLTSGGSAPYGQSGLASLMDPDLVSMDEASVRQYAETVAEVLINGLSVQDRPDVAAGRSGRR